MAGMLLFGQHVWFSILIPISPKNNVHCHSFDNSRDGKCMEELLGFFINNGPSKYHDLEDQLKWLPL
jgi:hypothetical protein